MNVVVRAIGPIAAMVMLGSGLAAAQGAKPLKKCPADAVVSGTVCMDKYEASVWRVPNPTTTNKGLVTKIQQGKATTVLLAAGGATQLGVGFNDDYAPCGDTGQNCTDDVYAVSLPGVSPSANITWFQALAACENSRKRLPTNPEWQAAVAGSPDPGGDNGTTDCNTTGAAAVQTGARASCVSARGAFDMVGNLTEYVGEWMVRPTACASWSLSGDDQCIAGAATTGEPGVLFRGGYFGNGSFAGPLAARRNEPSDQDNDIGFRCAR